jgi:hypothetical protein
MISLRVPDVERAAWQKQANLAGLTLSEWIRKRCASNGNGHTQPVRSADPVRLDQQSTGALERIAEPAREPESIPRTKGRCLHGKRIGERCWQCPGDVAA